MEAIIGRLMTTSNLATGIVPIRFSFIISPYIFNNRVLLSIYSNSIIATLWYILNVKMYEKK